MKVKLIIISIILLLVMVFACGCIPFMEKIGLINPTDEEQLSPEKASSDGLVKVLIGFTKKPGPPEQALVRGVGGKIKYTYNIVDAIAASIPEKAIEALQKNPNVRYVEPDGQVYALDVELDNSWGVKRIGAGVVHDGGNKGTGVKVAIIDSGIDYTHTDLDDNYAGGWDFVNGDNDPDVSTHDGPMDDNGHGTHVAGIVAALDNEVGIVGVAPEAFLYALKVLDETGRGYVSNVIAAIEWATDPDGNEDTSDRLDIINMSLGGGADFTLEEACQAAYEADLLLVASAGNSGNPPARGDNVGYPAAYGSVIAVAATDQSDVRARWSSTGPDVELAAPGVSIYSTYINDDYATYSGTSMASPHVAGTAALVWAAYPGWSNEAVRAQLQDTADDLGDQGRDSLYGYGLVNAAEAADVETPSPNDPPTVSITNPTNGSTFDSGATILFEGEASDPEDVDLTDSLVWTSNIDSEIGTGGSFSETLSDGDHTITAEVTDSGGKTGSASIIITVGTPSNIMHVSDIAFSAKKAGINLFLYTTVEVLLGDSAVNGAKVYMTLTSNESGSPWDFVGDTGSDGTVKFTLKAQAGNYTAKVTSVSHTDYDWVGVETENSCNLDEYGNITP